MQKKVILYTLFTFIAIFASTLNLKAALAYCEYGDVALGYADRFGDVHTAPQNLELKKDTDYFIYLKNVRINISLQEGEVGKGILQIEKVDGTSPNVTATGVMNLMDFDKGKYINVYVDKSAYYLKPNLELLQAATSSVTCPTLVIKTGSTPEFFYDMNYYNSKQYCGKNGKNCRYYEPIVKEDNNAGTGLQLYDIEGYYTEDDLDTIKEKQEEFNNNSNNRETSVISENVGFCVDYLGSARVKGTLANMLDRVFTIIKVAAILIAIILSMFDLSGVISSDKSELKPVFQKILKRVIVILIILLLPTIIDIVFGLFGYKEVLCGIR